MTLKLNKETKDRQRTLDAKSLIIGILGTLLICVTVALVITLGKSKDNTTNNGSIEDVISSTVKTEKLNKSEQKEAIDRILNTMDYIVNNNGYIQAYTSSDVFNTYIYNNKGEVVSQNNTTGYITVIRNDNNAIQYTDTVYQSEDIDVLSIARNALNAVGSNKITFEQVVSDVVDENEYDFKEYRVNITNFDALKALYSPVSNEFAELMVNNMIQVMGEDWTPEIYLYFVIGENQEFTCACHVIENGTEYVNWYVDGYSNLSNWELPEDWYTYDFSDETKSVEMCESLIKSLYSLIEQYAIENGIELEDETVEDSEIIDNNTDSENNTVEENVDASTEEVENTEVENN